MTDLENILSVTRGRGVSREAGIDWPAGARRPAPGAPLSTPVIYRGANLKQRGDVPACKRLTVLTDRGARQAYGPRAHKSRT